MDTKVIVQQEMKFGRMNFYPVSEAASLFCQLIKRSGGSDAVAKSLTEKQLKIIKKLGHEVEIVAAPVEVVRI